MKNAKKRNVSAFEVVWYSLCGAVALWGLTYIVLGLIANYADVPLDKNYLLSASEVINQKFGLGFLGWGLIILVIAVVCAVIVLLVVAGKVDRTAEKANRRAQRLAKLEAEMAGNAEENKAE